jgi:hypothetical protein
MIDVSREFLLRFATLSGGRNIFQSVMNPGRRFRGSAKWAERTDRLTAFR